MRHRTILAAFAITICPSAAVGQTSTEFQQADSLVLERTACFGTCPIYVVRLGKDGSVRLRAVDQRRGEHTATWRVDSALFVQLMSTAAWREIQRLPSRIENSPQYCPSEVTDNPTAIVTFYGHGWVKRIEDYHGCSWAPAALRDFEKLIDKVTGVEKRLPAP